jgi:Putative phage serine protease XkdF
MPEEQRFVLGIAYQAGPDPRIKKGIDGGRDFFSKSELERACWSYMRSGCPQMNAFHVDGTEDCAEPVESFIWRWDDWDVGDGVVVKDGDWCLGAILSPRMWSLHKAGKVNGLSPEGTARRRRVQKEGAVTVAKGSADVAEDDDEFSELVAADFRKVALVGSGANGIPRFLITKEDGESSALLDADTVRDLIAKAEPEPQEERVTMTGSPAAIAALIHGAPVAKAKNDAASRKHDAKTGAAMPSGSYPIETEADLTKAIHAVGRGGASHDSIRKHIISRARSLGASSKIPDNWNSDGSLKGDSVSKAGTVTKGEAGDMLDAQTDGGTDGMDPTVPLAEPGDDAPGDPTDPGSPAWEAIDAATAQKWCSILSRARVAVDLLSEREMLEAASADPGDAENAFDLQDACCAIDYVIGVLAPFAVAEQSEADCCGEEMLAAVGKAVAGLDDGSLERIEGFARIAKAGRVLSGANEQLIRTAGENLQRVLASLPQAPLADDTVTKETAMAADDTKPAGEPQDVAKETANAEPAAEAETVAKDAQAPAEPQEDVAKADAPEGKAKMVAVFDSKGDLVGVCDPGDITPIAGADAPASNEEAPAEAKPAEPAPDPADLTPAPAADAGTPADDVAKAGDPAARADEEDPQAVLKSTVTAALREVLDADPAKEEIRKQAELIAGQSQEIEALKARLETVENTPAAPKVFTNGAVPPPGTLRGQDQGAREVDVAKAREMRRQFASADPAEQNRLATEMQQGAIATLTAIHAAGPAA